MSDADLAELFAVDRDAWLAEADSTQEFFDTFEGRVPLAVSTQLDTLRARLI